MAEQNKKEERFVFLEQKGKWDCFVNSVSGLVKAVGLIIQKDKDDNEASGDLAKYEYYSRGETEDFNTTDREAWPTELSSYLDRADKDWRDRERYFYHEAYRLNPEYFTSDKTMVERLTRMQHYRLPTRFADLSSNALLAAYFACEDAYEKATRLLKDGNLRIFKIHPKKMKQFSSDVITAIAHLPLVTDEQFDIGDETNLKKNYTGLEYLSYEINKERPSFSLNGNLAERLRRDIQQVWAFKPIWNNDRIRYQEGIFLAFGCGNKKASLEATFSKDDFMKSELFDEKFEGQPAPSSGIVEIGRIAIDGGSKRTMLDELRGYGILKELVYPDLSDACKALAEQVADKANRLDEVKDELDKIVKSVKLLTGQTLKIIEAEDKRYTLEIDVSTTAESGREDLGKSSGNDLRLSDGDMKEKFWKGFRDYIRENQNTGEENLYEATKDDDVASDRRNWFNTHMVGNIPQGWFDLNFTYTKDRTISIYIATQNLATRDALTQYRAEIDAVMKGVMGNDMKSEWEKQNYPNRPNGIKRIVFSQDCAGETDKEIYPKMVNWLAVLAKFLSGKGVKLDFKKKIFNSSVFEI